MKTVLMNGKERKRLAMFASPRTRANEKSRRRAIPARLLLKRSLSATSLETTKRKPFDVLAEGPILDQSRGDRI